MVTNPSQRAKDNKSAVRTSRSSVPDSSHAEVSTHSVSPVKSSK